MPISDPTSTRRLPITDTEEAVEDLQAQFEQWLMETPPTEPGAIEAYRRCYEAVRAIGGQL